MSEKSWAETATELKSDLEYTQKWLAENDVPAVISVMLLEGAIATREKIKQCEQWAKGESKK